MVLNPRFSFASSFYFRRFPAKLFSNYPLAISSLQLLGEPWLKKGDIFGRRFFFNTRHTLAVANLTLASTYFPRATLSSHFDQKESGALNFEETSRSECFILTTPLPKYRLTLNLRRLDPGHLLSVGDLGPGLWACG